MELTQNLFMSSEYFPDGKKHQALGSCLEKLGLSGVCSLCCLVKFHSELSPSEVSAGKMVVPAGES